MALREDLAAANAKVASLEEENAKLKQELSRLKSKSTKAEKPAEVVAEDEQ